MSTDLLICPDCGGIIGADEATDHGRPCTCFKDKSGDTSVIGKPLSATKVCWKCGKDLTGRKRARDSMGYWCYECHTADKQKNKPQSVARCGECLRKVSETALIDYEGIRICSKCRDDHVEMAKNKRRFRAKVGESAYQQYDRKRLIMMVSVLGLLILIIVMKKLNIIGGPF